MTATAVPGSLLRPEDVAERLAVSRRTLYRLARDGEIGSVGVGASLRFTEQDVATFIESRHRDAGERTAPLRAGGRTLTASPIRY